jgi:hypothetical protein
LSILLGTNLAGLERFFIGRFGNSDIIASFMFLLILYLLIFPNQKVLVPAQNANLVYPDDLSIFQELERRLPINAKILIPNDSPMWDRGTDGGAWIEFFTGRPTIKLNYNVNLTSDKTLMDICAAGARYIYVGSRPSSFSMDEVEYRKHWYRPFIVYPNVKIYYIVGCPLD